MRGVLTLALLLAAVGEPTRGDFACGIAVRPETDAPLVRVRLPVVVYRTITRSDLGDLRVLNASGAIVPHELVRPKDEKTIERHRMPARVFPLVDASRDELSAIRIQIEKGGDEATVSLGERSSDRSSPLAYLLDPGPPDPVLDSERLILSWKAPPGGFVREVRVDESDDLSSWRNRGSWVVADLEREGERLLRNEVPVPSRSSRYLRLTMDDSLPGFLLESADLVVASKSETPGIEWLEVSTAASGEDFAFETPGPLRVEAMEVSPSERNTWVEIEVFSRPTADGEWIRRGFTAIYRFEVEGRELAAMWLPINSTRDRFWRLSTDEARGGFGASAPRIRVGYRPDDVVFVARGEAPYEIVYGSRKVGPPEPTGKSLLALANGEEKALEPARGLIQGEPVEISADALAEPLIADWKRFVLWAVLAAASLALLWTARLALRSSGAR